MVPTTQPEAIEQYSIRVVEAWKLGRAKPDDGVLLLVALEDRALRIEVGYGLEGALTDALSSRIINDTITPLFRQGDIFGGVNAGLDQIMPRGGWRGRCPRPIAAGGGPRQAARACCPSCSSACLAIGGVLRAMLGRTLGARGHRRRHRRPGLADLARCSGLPSVPASWPSLISLFAGLGGSAAGHRPPRPALGWDGRRRLWRWRLVGAEASAGRGFGGGGGGGFGGGGASGRWLMRVAFLRHLFTPLPGWCGATFPPASARRKSNGASPRWSAPHPGEVRFVVEHALELGDLIGGLTAARTGAGGVRPAARLGYRAQQRRADLRAACRARRGDRGRPRPGAPRRAGGVGCALSPGRVGISCRTIPTPAPWPPSMAPRRLLERHFPGAPGERNELPDQPLLL